MTSTPVSDATLFFSNISTKNQNVTGMSSASESFSQIMNKTSGQNTNVLPEQNQVAETSKDAKNVSEKDNDFAKENNVQEETTKKVDENTKSTDVEESKETPKTDEVTEEVKDELEEKAEELIGEIAKELGVTEEDVKKVLEELGISAIGLFDKENLTQVALVITGAEDVTQIVMDEDLFSQVNNLLGKMEEMLTEVSESTDVTVEELMEYVSKEEFKGNVEMEQADVKVSDNDVVMVEKEIDETVRTEVKNTENNVEETENTVKVNTSESTKTTNESTSQDMTHSEAEQNQQFLTNVSSNNTLQNAALNVDNGVNPYMTFEAREIMQQVLDYIKVSVKPDMSSVQMQLHPEELGTLQIEVSNKNGIVTAQFTTQDDSVKAIIEGQLIQLKESLNEQGMKVQAVEVTVASQQFDRNLDKNGREGTTQEGSQKTSKKQIRRINLNEMDMEDDMFEEDDAVKIAADMMARNGNTIDFMA